MSRKHKPQRGDKVNDKRRIPNANGFVQKILYDDGPTEVVVRFDDGFETYDYSEFEYCWTDHFGGVFELHTPNGGSSEANGRIQEVRPGDWLQDFIRRLH